MINGYFMFRYQDLVVLEKENDDNTQIYCTRYNYLDPKAFEQMTEISTIHPDSQIYLHVFPTLIILLNQALGCLCITKDKKIVGQLSLDMINVSQTCKTPDGILIF